MRKNHFVSSKEYIYHEIAKYSVLSYHFSEKNFDERVKPNFEQSNANFLWRKSFSNRTHQNNLIWLKILLLCCHMDDMTKAKTYCNHLMLTELMMKVFTVQCILDVCCLKIIPGNDDNCGGGGLYKWLNRSKKPSSFRYQYHIDKICKTNLHLKRYEFCLLSNKSMQH